jgi:Flp pilus assembly pilin Flp
MNRLFMKFRRNDDGAVMIEFALIAPMLFLLIFGILELGLIMLSMSTIESATNVVARTSRINNRGSDPDLVSHIRAEIQRRSAGLVDSKKVVITTEEAIAGVAPKAEECLLDNPPPGQCPGLPGVAYTDSNGDGLYTQPDLDVVGSGEIIAINVFYPYPILTPGLSNVLGNQDGDYMIESNTVVVNEAY